MENTNKKKKSTAAWITDFAGVKKYHYVLSIALAILGVLCSLVPYFYIADIIKHLMSQVKDWDYYVAICIKIAICWLIRHVLHSLSTTVSHYATFYVLGEIRKRLIHKLARIPLGTVLANSSGTYKNIICERVDSIETTLAHVTPEFTANICGSLAVLIYIFIIDWKMGLISLLTLPLGIAAYSRMMIGYEADYNNTIVKTKKLNDTAVEYINGIEVIKAFGKAKASYEKFAVAAQEGASCFVEWMRKHTGSMAFAMVVFPATLITILPFGTIFCLHNMLSTTDFIFVIILSFGVVTPLLTVMSYMDDLAQVGLIISEVAGILEKEDLVRPEIAPALPQNNEIVLDAVHFGYKDTEVLHGVSLRIKAGTVNALVGPSGSGKSTIAKLIASLWDVQSGSITVGGVDIKQLPLDVYNSYVSYVSQENYLFNISVRENIRMGNPAASDADVEAVAKECGCHDFIMSLEHGYDTVVGGAGGHVSGGERQRISIARAMLKNAPIVIMDEATSYTDPESEAIIQTSLARLVKGKTVIVIAHRLSTIADADCIFVINAGKVEASGTQDELLQKCSLYQQMWKAHLSSKDSE